MKSPQFPPRKIKGFSRYTIYQDGTITTDFGLIRPIAQNTGYTHVTLYKNKTPYQFSIHRLVAENFLTKKSKQQDQVNHINGIKNDNRVSNLEWCTHQENTEHAKATGLRDNVGEKHPMAKLNDSTVRIIRQKRILGESIANISKEYKISRTNIGDIIRRKIWKNVI